MSEDARHILVAVAWPYANGVQHLGHLAGCYLPADVFARYHRIAGNKVLMVSGSDAHGTPITLLADEQGVSAKDIVDRFHPRILEQWDRFGISFDLFTTTMTDNHQRVVWDVFEKLRAADLIGTRVTEQYYDEQVNRFLPDRYVEGTCPNCSYPDARGDQCDNCGKTLDPTDLINPRSRLSGATPVIRETEHYFILLPALEEPLVEWLEGREGWRNHVINWAISFVKDGLLERAITRDINWGVPLPPDAQLSGEGDKRFYVWFEAVIGYLSAAIEWAENSGNPDAWRDWWLNPSAESYYFIGKDNIPFHAVFWPSYLLGYNRTSDDELNLPTNVPANQYVTFKGEKASKSRGIGAPMTEYLERFGLDELRYAVSRNLPENADTDISEAELIRAVNEELVATWGNLVNRVFSMVNKNLGGVLAPNAAPDDDDNAMLAGIDQCLTDEQRLLEKVELRNALTRALAGASEVNAYLNRREPWKEQKSDPARAATTLFTAVEAINGLKVAFAPFVPKSSEAIHQALGFSGAVADHGWRRTPVPHGANLLPLPPLFARVEPLEDDLADA